MSATIFAQPTTGPPPLNSHRWGSITVFNGLPSDSVRAIAQTSNGVLWFGTDNGLARLYGRRMQSYDLGVGDANKVLALKADSITGGSLAIATQNGAFVYHEGRIKPVAGTEGVAVTSIAWDKSWIFATDKGTLLSASARPDGSIAAVEMTSEGLTGPNGPLKITNLLAVADQLLVATNGSGLYKYSNGKLTELVFAGRPMFINALAAGRNGDIWIGADAAKGSSGIFRYGLESKVGEQLRAPTAVVFGLESDAQGIWVGTARYGLFRLSPAGIPENYTFENTSGGLRSNTIFTIFTDREGVVWYGTNRGVSRYDATAAFQEPISDIPNRNFIRTLWRSNDKFLAGSNRGLFTLRQDGWKVTDPLSEKSIYSILRTSTGFVIGTPDGTFDTEGRQLNDGETRSLAEFGGRVYAAVLGRGVVDIGTKQIILNDTTANSLLATDGLLWIGTAGHGLFSYDGKAVKTETSPDQLKSGTIWNIRRSDDQSIWLAAEHGVFHIINGQIERVVEAEEVRDVLIDRGHVWAATTTRGVLHARHDERLGWLVSTIGFEQGLPSDKAFSILKFEDRLLFATNRGIVTYYPHDSAPRLMVTQIISERQHSETEFGRPIELEYPQNSLSTEVAGLSSRTFPEEFQYAFALKNSRGEVLNSRLATDSQFSAIDLAPGEYTIEAIAFDRDLNESDPVIVRFSVAHAPFPWTATALGILLVLALIGLVWAVIEHRRMRRRNRELAAARLDLANEAERERSRIARDLHDQTLADLRNLMMMSDKLPVESSEFRNEIEAVSGEIRRICEDLSPSVLENVGLIAALDFLMSRTIEHHKMTAPDDLEDRIAFPVNVQLQIYRIAQEVLNNIRSHSDATEVEMRVDISEAGRFELAILDNGQPFDPTKATPKGRGITNIKARASLINARISWRERKNGNRFTLQRD